MGVGSYLELYTSVYGWLVYDIIWSALTQTLIIYIPFLVILFSAMLSVVSAIGGITEYGENTIPNILADTLVKIFVAFIILLFAIAPTVVLSVGTISYQPRATFDEPAPGAITPNNDPTVFAQTFGTAITTDVKIPLIWNLIGRVSSGITFGVANSLPQVEDLEQALTTISTDQINDPQTAAHLSAFRQACFVPAFDKLSGWLDRNTLTADLEGLIDERGQKDIYWMGSPIYVETAGLYAPCDDPDICHESLQANKPIQGWPYEDERDGGWYSMDDIANDTPGRPYCDEWWDQIQSLLLDEVESPDVWDGLNALVTDSTIEDLQKLKVQKLLRNSEIKNSQMLATEVGAQFNDPSNGLIADSGVAATVGRLLYTNTVGKGVLLAKAGEYGFTGINAYSQYRKMSYYKKAIPAIIGIMLMVVPIIAQFAMLWKGYSFGSLITLGIVYFAIRFQSALFDIGIWVERNLIEATFGDFAGFSSYILNGGIDAIEGSIAFVFVLIAIFIMVPFIFLYLATSLGLAAGGAIASLQSSATSNVQVDSGAGFFGRGAAGKFLK